MAFRQAPRAIGSLVNSAGTDRSEPLAVPGGRAVFAGDGNDTLTGSPVVRQGRVLPSFMIGGNGDDSYRVKRGSLSVIADFGGGRDLIDLSEMNATSTRFADLDHGVIGAFDGVTYAVIVQPMGTAKTAIESLRFAGQNWTPSSLIAFGKGQGAYMGQLSFQKLSDLGMLNFSVVGLSPSSAGIKAILDAAAFNAGLIV
mgnify:CR=1 FL=1